MNLAARLRQLDVDAVGIGVALALCAAGYMLAVAPRGALADDSAAVDARARALTSACEEAKRRLERARRDVERLRAAVTSAVQDPPVETQRQDITRQALAFAAESGLQITLVTPLPAVRRDRIVAADVEIGARGTLAQLVAYLDRLRREIPSHTVEELTIAEERAAEPGRCAITLRLRLQLVAETTAAARGGP